MRIDEDVLPEFRQLSQSFNQMLERLNNAFAAQRQFTGNAAHELRTPLAEKRGITLEAEGDAALTGSDALIYRMLFNLTENAVKYNRHGGSVWVELARGAGKVHHSRF
jgi:signal transduction histidine kinase